MVNLFETVSATSQVGNAPLQDSSVQINLAQLRARAAQLGLTDKLVIDEGIAGLTLRCADSRQSPQTRGPQTRGPQTRAFAQELALVTKRPISLVCSNDTIHIYQPVAATFISPGWISDGYRSNDLTAEIAANLLNRILLTGDRAIPSDRRDGTPESIKEALKRLGIRYEIKQVGRCISLELDCSWQALGEPGFAELVHAINADIQHPELVQIILAPSADTALKSVISYQSQDRSPQLHPGTISLDSAKREVLLPFANQKDQAQASEFLFNACGWRAKAAPALAIPESHSIVLSVSPLLRSSRDLAPPTAKDLAQIGWVIPSWMTKGALSTIDRYVVVECNALPPERYLAELKERLSRTGIPVVLTIEKKSQPLPALALQELELSDLISYSLPQDCYVRKIKLADGEPIIVSLYSPATRKSEVRKLEATLNSLLTAASISSTNNKGCNQLAVCGVVVETQVPSPRLAGMFRRVGPVFQDFIARVAGVDGRIRLQELDENTLITEFNQASSPWGLSALPVPSNAQWLHHTGRHAIQLEDKAAFAIDVAGTQFCEDAFSGKLLNNGNFEVKAHIARVSRWVLPGSKLDADASRRRLAIYPPRGGHTLPLLPRELLLEKIGYKKSYYRPSWTITMEISSSGEFLHSKIEETEVRVSNFLSFSEASQVLRRADSPVSLSILQKVVKCAFPTQFQTNSANFDAGVMVEALLTLTERATEEHFKRHGLNKIAQRISGAGRDYRRLLEQYRLEMTFGYTRGISDDFARVMSDKMALDDDNGLVHSRRRGAQMMSEIQLLRAHLNDRRIGVIRAPGLAQVRGDGEQLGRIAVKLDAPFVTDYDCVLDPTVTAGYTKNSVRIKNPLSDYLHHIFFGQRVIFAITGIDLVAGKLTVKPIL